MEDWIIYAILGTLLALVFFLYLLIRRTVVGFKEGLQQGK